MNHHDFPTHQPIAPEAPIPGRHWYPACEPGGFPVGPDGICTGCGQTACPVCGAGFYPDGRCQCDINPKGGRTMPRFAPLLVVALVAAAVLGGTARAASTAPACTLTTITTGFARYLAAPAAAPVSVWCGPAARFFTLLHSMPRKPSSREYRTVVDAGIAADTANLAQITALTAQAVASQNAMMHCGLAPNPPNLCDNESLPLTAADVPLPAGLSVAAITADRTALLGLLAKAA